MKIKEHREKERREREYREKEYRERTQREGYTHKKLCREGVFKSDIKRKNPEEKVSPREAESEKTDTRRKWSREKVTLKK